MNFKYPTLYFCLSCLLLFACKGSEPSEKPIAPVRSASSEELPEDFKAFYKKFHADSIFQIEHITFPLEGLPNYMERALEEKYYWTPDNWRMHKSFDPAFSDFTREFNFNEYLVEEVIRDQNGFGTLRRFYKMDEEWTLIYYAGMNKLRQ